MDKIFKGSSYRLVKGFLESEALQFPRNVENLSELIKEYGVGNVPQEKVQLNEEGKQWLNSIMGIIEKEIEEKCTRGANRYSFVSHGNTGCIIAELSVDGSGKFFNWKAGSVIISLCTCGNLGHWGGVILPENYLGDKS